ncbi:hypothetical protein [uncultured Limnobacter sp.]|uniref:hypothetical protein n=1 Tax=uncultured Limnobacter sp. TaxID=199681 RepID=UPI0032B2BE28|tara:strand:- start:221 stop:715 length:495 start_codon:yes stop_codon:yes gene_type:complete
MSKFTDTEGRVWNVQLTVHLVKEVKQRLDVDLLDEQVHETLTLLTGDIVKSVDVLYILCSSQADKNEISDVEFGESLYGDVLFEGINAMVEALIDFFPNPKKRMWIRRLWEKSTSHMDKTNDEMLNLLDDEKIEKELEHQREQSKKKAINEAISGLKSSNLQES